MKDEILNKVGHLSTPGFFITVEFSGEADTYPVGLETFIFEKLEKIREGVSGRKFTFQEGEWRLILTFFPTDRVVDERYAMKNRMV